MPARQPEGPPPPPVVQRIRIRYAKRGRLRFVSHRDFARAFERALRRAAVPMAYSAGFSPRPRISYVGAAPTGVASEAEYLEIALAAPMDPAEVVRVLDAALPDGLDVLDAVDAAGTDGALSDRVEASHWRIVLPGVTGEIAHAAVASFLAAEHVPVQRMLKDGPRTLDARSPVVRLAVVPTESPGVEGRAAADADVCAILELVVRQVTPTVRPDDVLEALRATSGFDPAEPPRATRLAYGPLAGDSVGSAL